MRKTYTSDLSDEQWALIEPLIPPQRTGGDRRTTNMRDLIDAILYVLKNGCQWRDLPGDFDPDWHTVYAYFNQWSKDGTWQRIYDVLHRRYRQASGREETPSAAILDSQSVKGSASGGQERGFDGGKQIKGRKRHLMVSTQGLPISVHVTAASTDDRFAAKELITRLEKTESAEGVAPPLGRLSLVWADAGYEGAPFAAFVSDRGWRLEIKHKEAGKRGFQVLSWRWVVERTFSWLMQCRRLVRDFERLVKMVEGFIYVAMTRLLLRRLTRASVGSVG